MSTEREDLVEEIRGLAIDLEAAALGDAWWYDRAELYAVARMAARLADAIRRLLELA